MKLKKKVAVATAVAMGATSGLSVFEQFALAAFNNSDWESFKTSQEAAERNKEQRVKINTRTDRTSHSNYTTHTNKGSNTDERWYDHSNHAQHSQNDNEPYYIQLPGQHTNEYEHTNNGVKSGHYNSRAGGWSGWGYDHLNQVVEHNQSIPRHNQHSNHTNNNPHTNYNSHSNYGFNHTNYIPSQPQFYNVADRPLGRVEKIGLYSYDKNKDGHGSQDTASIDVYYDLYIRPLNGSWTKLVDNQKANSGEGFLYDLDTTKFPDGDYELRAIARNQPRNERSTYVTYESYEKIVRVKIQQNYTPEITIQNSNEFINFTFGFEGALSPANVYKRYQDRLYAEGKASEQEGLFVKIQMIDRDTKAGTIQNWQRGRIYLINPSGNPIAGASANIVWTDTQSFITSSEGKNKTGIAFIPKEAFVKSDMKNAKVVVEVTDYKDAACTEPAGTTVRQTTISRTNLTQTTFHVDVTKPTVTANDTNYNWRNRVANVGLTFTDLTSGIHTRQYQITDKPIEPTTWKTYTGSIPINQEGQWYIWYRAVDKVRNEQVGYYGSYKYDITPPEFFAEQFDVPGKDDIRIELTVTDNLSGVKRIQLPNGTWVNGSRADYTVVVEDVTPFTFRAEDNAGNIGTHTVIVNPAPRIYGLKMTGHVNAPRGVSPSKSRPIVYPVSSPTNIKVGYMMTFDVETKFADKVEVILYDRSTGQRVKLYTTSGEHDSIIVDTGTRLDANTEIRFWLDGSIKKGTELDMKVIGHRIRTDGIWKSTVDDVLGNRFAVVVGSAKEDSEINQTN